MSGGMTWQDIGAVAGILSPVFMILVAVVAHFLKGRDKSVDDHDIKLNELSTKVTVLEGVKATVGEHDARLGSLEKEHAALKSDHAVLRSEHGGTRELLAEIRNDIKTLMTWFIEGRGSSPELEPPPGRPRR